MTAPREPRNHQIFHVGSSIAECLTDRGGEMANREGKHHATRWRVIHLHPLEHPSQNRTVRPGRAHTYSSTAAKRGVFTWKYPLLRYSPWFALPRTNATWPLSPLYRQAYKSTRTCQARTELCSSVPLCVCVPSVTCIDRAKVNETFKHTKFNGVDDDTNKATTRDVN